MNRLDHFAWVVRAENIERYVAKVAEVFDREFDHRYGPENDGSPINAYVDWVGGLEVIAPIPNEDGSPFDPTTQPVAHALATHLEEHGEGAFGVIFRVPDLAAAAERLNAIGYDVRTVAPHLANREARLARNASWTKNVIDIDEALVEKFLNTHLIIGAFEYPDE
jgi:hypothetical protein